MVAFAGTLALGVAPLGVLGCRGSAHASSPAAAASPVSPRALVPVAPSFDAKRAYTDLERLIATDDRRAGGRGSAKARKRLAKSLSRSGLEVIEIETPLAITGGVADPVIAVQLFARVEGDDRDAILLVAPYDTPVASGPDTLGTRSDGSGAAILLELARLDQQAREAGAERPLALWFALIEGDGLVANAGPVLPTEFPGSERFAVWLATRPEAGRIRLVVFVDRVADPHLEVARDLYSNLTYRDTFFAEAALLQHAAFDAESMPSARPAGHRAFVNQALAPVVAIVGVSSLVDAFSSRRDDDLAETVSPESLLAVGETVWTALERIAVQLTRIDAFRADPLGAIPGDLSLPGAVERDDSVAITDEATADEQDQATVQADRAGPATGRKSVEPVDSKGKRRGAPGRQKRP